MHLLYMFHLIFKISLQFYFPVALASVSTIQIIIIIFFYQIWEDILGFENAEFYIKRWPQLDGLLFEDVLISFPDAVPCGVKVAAEGGKININPDDNYVLKEGDEILVIAEDDDTYTPGPLPEVILLFALDVAENWILIDDCSCKIKLSLIPSIIWLS